MITIGKMAGFILGLALTATAATTPVAAANSYDINSGATVEIDEHEVCRRVKNNSDLKMRIPTKSASEWSVGANAFLGAQRDLTTVSYCFDATIDPLRHPVTLSGWGASTTPNKYSHSVAYYLSHFSGPQNFKEAVIFRIDFDGGNVIRISDYIDAFISYDANFFQGKYYTNLKAAKGEAIARKRASYFVFAYQAGNGTPYNYRVLHAEPELNSSYQITGSTYSLHRNVVKKGPYDKIILPYSVNGNTEITLTAAQVAALTNANNKLYISNPGMKVVLDGATLALSNADGDFYRFPSGELVVTHRGNTRFSLK